jgi:hypothetical protein
MRKGPLASPSASRCFRSFVCILARLRRKERSQGGMIEDGTSSLSILRARDGRKQPPQRTVSFSSTWLFLLAVSKLPRHCCHQPRPFRRCCRPFHRPLLFITLVRSLRPVLIFSRLSFSSRSFHTSYSLLCHGPPDLPSIVHCRAVFPSFPQVAIQLFLRSHCDFRSSCSTFPRILPPIKDTQDTYCQVLSPPSELASKSLFKSHCSLVALSQSRRHVA